jgi:hypothetical protein
LPVFVTSHRWNIAWINLINIGVLEFCDEEKDCVHFCSLPIQFSSSNQNITNHFPFSFTMSSILENNNSIQTTNFKRRTSTIICDFNTQIRRYISIIITIFVKLGEALKKIDRITSIPEINNFSSSLSFRRRQLLRKIDKFYILHFNYVLKILISQFDSFVGTDNLFGCTLNSYSSVDSRSCESNQQKNPLRHSLDNSIQRSETIELETDSTSQSDSKLNNNHNINHNDDIKLSAIKHKESKKHFDNDFKFLLPSEIIQLSLLIIGNFCKISFIRLEFDMILHFSEYITEVFLFLSIILIHISFSSCS